MRTSTLMLFFVVGTFVMHGQNRYENDSIQIIQPKNTNNTTKHLNDINNVNTEIGTFIKAPKENSYNNIGSDSIVKRLEINIPPVYKGPMDTPGRIPTTNIFENEYSYHFYYSITNNSGLGTASSLHVYPGMGAINTISANYNYQPADWLSISLGTYISKYSVYTKPFNDIGTNANVKFYLNDRFRINAFGQYSAFGKQNGIGGNAQGMYPQSLYGTSLEYKINEKFGIQGGVVRELDATTGKWKNRPFIAPVFYGK